MYCYTQCTAHSTQAQHTGTAHRHSTQAQHTGTAHRRSTQHTGTAHRHSTQAQHTGTAHSTQAQHTGTAHRHSTQAQHTAHRLSTQTPSCVAILLFCFYFQEFFVEVMRNQEFLLLPPGDIATLLASEDINVPNEEMVFHALVMWVKHDTAKRSQHLGQLLAHIKLPLLSPQVSLWFHLGNKH